MTYNGWKNYETWALGMYLDGNYTSEGTYRELLALAEQHRDDARDVDDDAYTLAGALKEYVEADLDLGESINGLALDLIGAALSEVIWQELATSKLAEVTS
jgi:hypothetical protein